VEALRSAVGQVALREEVGGGATDAQHVRRLLDRQEIRSPVGTSIIQQIRRIERIGQFRYSLFRSVD